MRGYEKDFSILLDSNREREAFTNFLRIPSRKLNKAVPRFLIKSRFIYFI